VVEQSPGARLSRLTVAAKPARPDATGLPQGTPLRPLCPPGRAGRLGPFAAVTGVGLIVAVLPPLVDPVPLMVAAALTGAISAAIAWLPWHRWPPSVEAVPALAYFWVVALLRAGDPGTGTGFAVLALLPVLWVAIYHGRTALWTALVLVLATFLAPALLVGPTPATADWRRAVLWIGAGSILGLTIQHLVGGWRASNAALAVAMGEARRERDFTIGVLDSAGHLVVVTDADERITVFNRAAESTSGLTAPAVLGRPAAQVLWADASGAARAFLDALRRGQQPDGFESTFVGADGARRQVAWRGGALTDPDGRLTHLVATGMDVTEQRRAERLFENVLAAATEQAIIGTDPTGVITVFNAGAQRLLGHTPAEVVGTATFDLALLPEEVAARAAEVGVPPGLEALFAPARAGGGDTREWTYVRRDGSRVRVELTMTVIRDGSGEIAGYLGVARDVTQERTAIVAIQQAYEREHAAAARLRELDRVRSDLVATVSHELRTPLTSILGNVELLVDGDAGALSQPQARLLSAVERNSRRLLALIEDLLMLSRIESGTVKINVSPVPVDAFVGGALEALESQRAGRGVDLKVRLPAEPLLVSGDQRQLERVVINLLDNALKFTPAGGTAELAVEATDAHVRLVVRDDGIGIPENELPYVFERFFRSSRSQERAAPGSGLGLTVTRSIVERHGGEISVRSAPDTGTVVICLLPRPTDVASTPAVRP
jgi:PAS domain S-box-containing protein